MRQTGNLLLRNLFLPFSIIYAYAGRAQTRRDAPSRTMPILAGMRDGASVTQLGSLYYCYDANGNMTRRGASDSACSSGGDTLTYDYENRLTRITVGANTTTYVGVYPERSEGTATAIA